MPMAGAPRTTMLRIASPPPASSGRTSTVSAGQPRLVEKDDRIVLEAGDPVRGERG